MNPSRCATWFRFITLLGLLPTVSWAQVNFTTSNLPIIVINTQGAPIVDEPKISATMGIIDNGPGTRNNLTDPFNDFEGGIGIEIRGSSSQSFPKKQYGVEVRNPDGSDSTVSLLGMPAESDWVLYAPYSDKSLMRNILAYQLGRDLGHYAPRTKLCEVVLNGDYQGVYVLIEKIKRDKNRVDVARLRDDEISGDDLTGGYILKIDKGNDAGWTSDYPPLRRRGDQTIVFQYEYPDGDDIAPEQQAYIRQYVSDFEDALAGDNFADPEMGYARYIDVNSFVDYLIANEVARNPDAYRISTFLHKQKDSGGGKLVMGPIWDFNLGFGNVDFCLGGSPQGLVLRYNSVCPGDFWLIPFWWDRLAEDPAFAQRVSDRWAELRADVLSTERIVAQIDSITSLVSEAQERNFVRWPALGQYVWPNAFVGSTYAEEVAHLKNWTTDRLNWLDANLSRELTLVTDLPPEVSAETLRVYPNPFEETLTVQWATPTSETGSVQFYNLLGKMVWASSHGPTDGPTVNLNTANLPPGLYVVHLQVGDQRLRQKVNKQ